METSGNTKILGISLSLVVTFAFVELIGGFLTNSLALISDAGHMFTDSVSLLIALVAQLLAEKVKGTRRTTYGLYRLEVLAALGNGVLLLGLVGYIAYEAFQRFLNPKPVLGPPMLLIASLGLGVNLLVGYLLLRAAQKNINVRSALLHVVMDALGSVAAILAGIAVTFWGFYLADPILSAGISLIILPGAYSVIRESISVLLEIVPPTVDPEEVEREIRELKGVLDVHDLHIWSITSGSVVLTTHVVVSEGVACNDIIKSVEDIARRHGINHTTVQVEGFGHTCPPFCPLLKEKPHHHH